MFGVQVWDLSKSFGPARVLEDVSFRVEPGELVALLGPSGCGKSTLLRCLAGLERPDRGRVLLDGEDVTSLPPQRRNLGMVFQHYALFPNLRVEGNVAFGLEMAKVPREEVRRRVGEILRMVELEGLGHRYPRELSGGQRQRVALARALVPRPRVLLLDEPLSALDARIRRSLREQIRRIQRETGVTTLFVTHDQEEALEVSDRIFLMDRGKLVQQGKPGTVYGRPATEFAARFMGQTNFLSPELGSRLSGRSGGGPWILRPEAIRIGRPEDPVPDCLAGPFGGTVREARLLGNVVRYEVDLEGQVLLVDDLNRTPEDLFAPGVLVALHLDPRCLQEVAG